MIRRGVAAVEEHPRHAVRLDEGGFCRSMDRNETEATFGGHLHRCIDGVEPVTLAMNVRQDRSVSCYTQRTLLAGIAASPQMSTPWSAPGRRGSAHTPRVYG
jgi:hypothetical protein